MRCVSVFLSEMLSKGCRQLPLVLRSPVAGAGIVVVVEYGRRASELGLSFVCLVDVHVGFGELLDFASSMECSGGTRKR